MADDPNPPISPRTAANILDHATGVQPSANTTTLDPVEAAQLLWSQQDINEMVRATAFGLISTIHKRDQQSRMVIDRANQNNNLLARRLSEREAEIIRLEERLGDPVKPDGFVENNGNIRHPLPCDNGTKVVP
jgi:hypothetical protein